MTYITPATHPERCAAKVPLAGAIAVATASSPQKANSIGTGTRPSTSATDAPPFEPVPPKRRLLERSRQLTARIAKFTPLNPTTPEV